MATPLEIAGLVAMTGGVFVLSRAEAVHAMHSEAAEPL